MTDSAKSVCQCGHEESEHQNAQQDLGWGESFRPLVPDEIWCVSCVYGGVDLPAWHAFQPVSEPCQECGGTGVRIVPLPPNHRNGERYDEPKAEWVAQNLGEGEPLAPSDPSSLATALPCPSCAGQEEKA